MPFSPIFIKCSSAGRLFVCQIGPLSSSSRHPFYSKNQPLILWCCSVARDIAPATSSWSLTSHIMSPSPAGAAQQLDEWLEQEGPSLIPRRFALPHPAESLVTNDLPLLSFFFRLVGDLCAPLQGCGMDCAGRWLLAWGMTLRWEAKATGQMLLVFFCFSAK